MDKSVVESAIDLNFDIRGAIAHEWIVQSDGKDLYVRRYFVPFNPQSPAQISRRNLFKAGVQSWQGLTNSEKQVYNDKAVKLKFNMTGFNLFMSNYLKS